MRYYLEFEKKLQPLERRVDEIRKSNDIKDPRHAKELASLAKKISKLEQEVYGSPTNWQKAQLSRHLNRPHALDYIHNLFTDFVELHGDRKFKDDAAIVAGFAKFNDTACVVVGHQKGGDVREMARRNFGMAGPEGYRKAMRLMELGSRWKKPIVTFIDTPGAFPGVGAEERGQAEAIAASIYHMFTLSVPIIVLVIGEGGSGGALALGVGDRILMLENTLYSVISPEGCAAILWRDGAKAPLAADALKPTAGDLYQLKVVDEIVHEPFGGAHRNWDETFSNVRIAIARSLKELKRYQPDELRELRYEKFRRMGIFSEGR